MKTDEELLEELRAKHAEWNRTAAGRLERFVWAWGTEPASFFPHTTMDTREVLDELYVLRDEVDRPKELVQNEKPLVLKACVLTLKE